MRFARSSGARPDRTYEIHEVAELTGLAPARLRVWERRYQIVRPRRMPNGYRAYSEEQVALLRAYARLIGRGRRIGHLAARSREEVLAEAGVGVPDHSPQVALVEAVRAFDRESLENLLAQELARLGLRAFADEVVLPLAQSVGDLWALGKLPIAAEHLASEVVVHALKGALRPSRGPGPLVVGACLPGERHEWGFLAALARVRERGWRIHYVGADLPVEDVIEVARKLLPRWVAFSGSDPAVVLGSLPALTALTARLPPGTLAAIGGAGVEPHARALRGMGFRVGVEAFTAGPRDRAP